MDDVLARKSDAGSAALELALLCGTQLARLIGLKMAECGNSKAGHDDG